MLRQRVRPGLKWKIVAPYAILSLFGAFFVTRLIVGSLQERFNNQLVEASRGVADAVVRQERDHLAAVRAVTFTEGFTAALERGDRAEIQSIALPVAANLGVQRLEVLDARGQRLVGVRATDIGLAPLTEPEGRTGWPFVQRVINPVSTADSRFAGIVETPSGFVLYSASPVRLPSGKSIGAVMVGTPLAVFAGHAKGQTFADVSLYGPDGALVASTFPAEADAAAGPQVASANLLQGGLLDTFTSAGREYAVLYQPLHVRGEQWGWASVALPRSFVMTSTGSARTTFALLFAGGTVAVLIVGWLLARSLTHPLGRLAEAAVAVSRGDLSVRSGVRSTDEIGDLAQAFDSMAERLQRSHVSTLGALVSSIDARDAYTRGHSVRVGHLARDIGQAMSLYSGELQSLLVGGMLHDIGKIGIRDAVLLKPGQLTAEERAAIQEHPRIGLRILDSVDLPPEVVAGVGGHHERINGSGYPLGLTGDAVSLYPRIISVADVYDALITDRPYRAALPLVKVLAMLDEEVERGLLDADVVRTMHAIAMQWEERRHSDRNLEGFALDAAPPAMAIPVRMSA